jgi:hypothetical protein
LPGESREARVRVAPRAGVTARTRARGPAAAKPTVPGSHAAEPIASSALLDDFWTEVRNLRERAAQDPASALAAAASLPEGIERTQALTAVCLGAAETDPEAALEIARALDPTGAVGAVGDAIVQHWAANDAGAALAWTDRLAAGAERDACLADVIAGEAPANPSAAAQLAMQELPAGELRHAALLGAAHDWARQDPVAAAGWIERLASGTLKDHLLAEVGGVGR